MSKSRNEAADETVKLIELPEDHRHDLLRSKRRRLALEILDGTLTTMDLEELAATIATRENGWDTPDDATIERVLVELHHNHLPRLADVGVVGYDPDDQVVDPTPLATFQLTGSV